MAKEKGKILPIESTEPTQTESLQEYPHEIVDVDAGLASFPTENLITVEPVVTKMTPEEVSEIVYKTANLYGIHPTTAVNAISEMIRKGGANVVTPPSFSITIKCPQQNVVAEVQKRDIVRTIELVCREKKNFRNLADTFAVPIIKSGLKNTQEMPSKDFSGDLARKISVRLAFNGRPPLTPQERVGCASYAQHIPNLNELVGSDRLSSLLAEDLQFRRTSAPKKKKGTADPKNQGKMVNQQKNTIKKEDQLGPSKKSPQKKKGDK